MHVGGVEPDEERGLRADLPPHELLRRGQELVVDRLHPLLRERAGIFNPLCAVGVGPGVDHAPRTKSLAEVGEVLRRWVVGVLGLLFGVEVIEVAEELIEAVRGRQVLVLVPEVVLAKLPGGIAEGFEQLGDGRVLGLEPEVRAWQTDLAEPGAEDALAGDEGRPAGGAALFAVGVGEAHAFVGEAVDVGGAIPHQPVAITAQVGDADIVAPDHEDVRLLVRHDRVLSHALHTVTMHCSERAQHGWSKSEAIARRAKVRSPFPTLLGMRNWASRGQARRQRMHQMVRTVCNTTAGHSAAPAICTASPA